MIQTRTETYMKLYSGVWRFRPHKVQPYEPDVLKFKDGYYTNKVVITKNE